MTFANEKQIEELPTNKKAFHKDSSIKNLYIEINPTKNNINMAFYFRFKKQSKIISIHLGKYPLVSLSQARLKALELNEKLDSSQDLEIKPKKEKKYITLQELFDEWYDMASKNRKNQDFSKPFELHILKYHHKKEINKIAKRDIIICLDKLYFEGKRVIIKRSYSILKTIMSFALHRDYIQYRDILHIDLKFYMDK